MPREAPPVRVKTEQAQEIHPDPGPPVRLKDETWFACENNTMVCMKPADAKATLENKVVVGQWVDRAWNVIEFYQTRGSVVSSPDALKK